MGILKAILGLKTNEERFSEFQSKAKDRHSRILQQGSDFADEVFERNIKVGECVTVSALNAEIRSKYGIESYRETAKLGFWQRFMEYADAGHIDAYRLEDGDDVYVHPDWSKHHFGDNNSKGE
ncbi:hypothetical protein [Salinisphaera dokdonensis]|uniref:hypothetical protein n=1 Tax=Salinisphaera dokdonensis TaxID=454598 RepID=UPI00334140D4